MPPPASQNQPRRLAGRDAAAAVALLLCCCASCGEGQLQAEQLEDEVAAPPFCEFCELVGALEDHVQSGGDTGGAHEPLWARCRDLHAVIGGMNLADTLVAPTCDGARGAADGPVCDLFQLVEVYLLQGETGETELLSACIAVRNQIHVAAASCNSAPTPAPQPTPDTADAGTDSEPPLPLTDLVDANLTAGVYNLSVSGSGMLATLVQVVNISSENATLRRLSAGGSNVRSSAIPVARSYNGNDWEGSMPSPLTFTCSGHACATALHDANGACTYELRVYNATELVAPSPEKVAARFLTQATLGPKRDEIRDLSAGSLEETEARIHDWVHAQMNDVEPSLHRAYLRHRFNPYASSSSGTTAMRSPCKEGSSWVDIAFSRVDQVPTSPA